MKVCICAFVALWFASGVTVAMAQQQTLGKTRDRVLQETEQAWRTGWLPFTRHDYPPDAKTLKRNRERYMRQHPEERQSSPQAPVMSFHRRHSGTRTRASQA